MTAERWARSVVALLALGLSLAALAVRWHGGGDALEIHARMSETGGWTPSALHATVGRPLRLRLTSDDVVHGFAVGQQGGAPVDVKPGEVTETTLVFDRPGTYTFYCTRWCGPDHWRMRGTIDVSGPSAGPVARAAAPLYVTLGLDPDAPRAARVRPAGRPSASRGESSAAGLHVARLTRDAYLRQSPVERWETLRRAAPRSVSDMDLWDAVAAEWRSVTTPRALEEGRALFAKDCAACHGETGAGDGVMAPSIARFQPPPNQPGRRGPANFTDAARMLGASPAVLQGKIIRGGMGTGMPSWGPILTDAETWALVDFLWTFQFDESGPSAEQPPRR